MSDSPQQKLDMICKIAILAILGITIGDTGLVTPVLL